LRHTSGGDVVSAQLKVDSVADDTSAARLTVPMRKERH